MWRDPQQANPPGADRDLGAGRGKKRGEHTVTGHGGRCRHAERVAETSGRGWRVAGVGNVQVDGALRQEKGWGSGASKRDSGNGSYLWVVIG